MRRFLIGLLVVACLSLAGACATTPKQDYVVRPDEDVVLFPTAAYFDAVTAQWVAPVHGWIHKRPNDSVWTSAPARALMKVLDLDEDALAQSIFRARARWFLAGTEEDRTLVVRVGAQQITAHPSGENGLFHATATLSRVEAARDQRGGGLPVAIVDAVGRDLPFEGSVRLVGPDGLSLISDIDDTVKKSNVRDKRALVANTFVKPFEAVPGMAEAYAAWAARGAAFHYVSSSPWQLYPSLADFFAEAGLPAGAFHLREIGFGDRSFLKLFDAPADAKVPTIREIIGRWPQRRFVLIGDSGEQDPEVYAQIYHEFPQSVLHIYIRNVTGEDEQAPRYVVTFKATPRDRWSVFSDPAVVARGAAASLAR